MADLWDFLFPKKCVVCGEAGRFVCQSCFEDLRPARRRYGELELVSVFDYSQKETKMVIKAIKYRLYRGVVEELLERLVLDEGLRAADLIVPIPLHRERENWRGFNQAELLAEGLGRRLGIEKRNVLERVVKTRPLAEMRDRKMRDKEIRGVFRVKEKVGGKTVLLVDDVFTSGATMREAAGVLKQAGARRVIGFVLAS